MRADMQGLMAPLQKWYISTGLLALGSVEIEVVDLSVYSGRTPLDNLFVQLLYRMGTYL
jgi:hypothetical protein